MATGARAARGAARPRLWRQDARGAHQAGGRVGHGHPCVRAGLSWTRSRRIPAPRSTGSTSARPLKSPSSARRSGSRASTWSARGATTATSSAARGPTPRRSVTSRSEPSTPTTTCSGYARWDAYDNFGYWHTHGYTTSPPVVRATPSAGRRPRRPRPAGRPDQFQRRVALLLRLGRGAGRRPRRQDRPGPRRPEDRRASSTCQAWTRSPWTR